MTEKKTPAKAKKTESPEAREKRLQFHRDYYAKNKEQLRAKAKARREENPEKHREAFRRYYDEHKDERREVNAKREKAMQEKTLESATKRFQPWTEGEDAELLASDLTSHELAAKLGRTYAATSVRRARLRKEERERDQEAAELQQIALEESEDEEDSASLDD